MKPTEEQLKDPQWWSENAPEGAQVWVVCDNDWDKWIKWVDGVEFELEGDIDGEYFWWVESSIQLSLGDYERHRPFKFYTRPEPESEPEWQPKVGDVCLASRGKYWMEAELLKLLPNGKWIAVVGCHSVIFADSIKPLPKTPREQFVEKAAKQFDYRVDDLAALYDLAMEFK